MSDTDTTIDTLDDALAALRKVRKADAAKRTKIDELEAQMEADAAKLAALPAYEALGSADDLKARLTAGDAATKALETNGVTLEALPDLLKQAQEAARLQSELVYSRAAGTEYDPAKLQKIAPGLTAREVEKDGATVTEYGIPGEKDAWTPLADAISGWEPALKRDGTPQAKPEPKPLPTGGAGGKAEPVSVIQQRIQARQQTQATAPDPFKPTPGGNT